MQEKIPYIATYRLQMNKSFRFADILPIIPYIKKLGISHLYLSPIFKSRSGSEHGYDVCDPNIINPELGTIEELIEISEELQSNEIGILLDIVPNHMATDYENPFFRSILENGKMSPFAHFFDINWDEPESSPGVIILPVLGNTYGTVLDSEELKLEYSEDGFIIRYYEHKFPVDPTTYPLILNHYKDIPEVTNEFEIQRSFYEFEIELNTLGNETDVKNRYNKTQTLKNRFNEIYNTKLKFKETIDSILMYWNERAETSERRRLINELHFQQNYRLRYWKSGQKEINYRRFFNINHLIGVRVEDRDVFHETHKLILDLVKNGVVQGLRIDHIDGLLDPAGYLNELNRLVKEYMEPFIVVEKILGQDEALPEDWSIAGTTGYDFINEVGHIFIDSKGLEPLDELYRSFTGERRSFEDIARVSSLKIIRDLLSAELERLGKRLKKIASWDAKACDFSGEDLKDALISFTASLSVYRTYIRKGALHQQDRQYIDDAFQASLERIRNDKNMEEKINALTFVRNVLLQEDRVDLSDRDREEREEFAERYQQFTGPVMAKGHEDTALYRYARLLSLNEVGGNPGISSYFPERFHIYNQKKQRQHPFSMNTSSTHDTKRSGDIRARLHVFSEIPELLGEKIKYWTGLNESKKKKIDNRLVPAPFMEIFIYRTIMGSLPYNDDEFDSFRERIKLYMLKAAREAKLRTDWDDPDPYYEDQLISFVESLLNWEESAEFLQDLKDFVNRIAPAGALNSIGKNLLKITCPGISDIYQGNEIWDLSLVDPDNRRYVDYQKRLRMLNEIIEGEEKEPENIRRDILENFRDGRIKMYVIWKALQECKKYPDLFTKGDYIPLKVETENTIEVFSFMRIENNLAALVAIPRLVMKHIDNWTNLSISQNLHSGKVQMLEGYQHKKWLNVFTGEMQILSDQNLQISYESLFKGFPLALYISKF
ncbi:MAG: malto-oligosyltrehalose synthase [Leptospiraceae bacterium]|nr:malto-oligosyltrehalose synthase [Leptospiraceae bacterium]